MKKFTITLAALLACTLLAACGDKGEKEGAWAGMAPGSDLEAITERTEYYDLTIETEELFDLGLWEKNPEKYSSIDIQWRGVTVYNLLGTQFVMGEPEQLWAEVSSAGVDIYLYRTDGSRELLLQGLSDDGSFVNAGYGAYVDQDKNCYFYRTAFSKIDGESKYVGTVMKILPTGEVQYKNTLEPGLGIEDIRQIGDGRIYMMLSDLQNHKKVLMEFDPDTGQLIPEPQVGLLYADINIGDTDGSLALAGLIDICYGIGEVDMEAQNVSQTLFFDGTSYGWHYGLQFQDFRVQEDGTIEFLWTDKQGRGCFLESMRMERVEKTPIVLRGIFFADFWLSEQVALFNQKSSDYHVVFENCGPDNDIEDFARLTSVQVGAGKGPDILCSDELLHDYISGMTDKGALEALNPYMEASGIREEDYFPFVFATWRKGEEIYSVTPKMDLHYEEMDAEVLGSGETPDIGTLADALLAREGSAVYRKRLTSGEMLNSFLQGSESLWGMVDWEAGRCDFNTPLFGKLLEAARRYGYDDRKSQEPEITSYRNLEIFFGFNSPEELEEKEKVSTGILFDDGCHAVSLPSYSMAVNANSANKEGAWEFLVFLLGEEVQYREEAYQPPVHRAFFDKWLEWEINWFSEVRYVNGGQYKPVYYGYNTPEEKREAYKKAIEDARPLPIRTAPILTIILDEAADYFSGSKSAEEVSRIINNRVQLYLDEGK